MTQCPRGLDCAEHRDVNTKFLSGYQVLKHGQDSSAAAAAAAAAFQERDLEVERMKGRVKDMAQIKYGVPYSVCMVLTWQVSVFERGRGRKRGRERERESERGEREREREGGRGRENGYVHGAGCTRR